MIWDTRQNDRDPLSSTALLAQGNDNVLAVTSFPLRSRRMRPTLTKCNRGYIILAPLEA